MTFLNLVGAMAMEEISESNEVLGELNDPITLENISLDK
jgi:hypothetical protein